MDVDELMKEQEEKKKKLQAAQTKIIRTNAVGEAFKLLTEAVGGSQGASIVPRQPNQGIFQASQRFNNLEDQYNQNLERLKLTGIAQREKDLQYNLALQAEERQRGWQKETEQRKVQEDIRQDDVNFQQQKQLQDERLTADVADRKQQLSNAMALERVQTEEHQKRQGIGTVRTDRSKPLNSKTDKLFIIPGTFEKIYLGQDEIAEMAYRLYQDAEAKIKMTNPGINERLLMLQIEKNPKLQLLRTHFEGGIVRPDNLIQIIKDNWDKAKLVLPEFASQAPAQPAYNSPLLPGYQPKQQFQQGTGPLKSYGGPAGTPTVATPKVQKPEEMSTGILKDAKGLYDKANTVEEVSSGFIDLINNKYPGADPNTKAAIYNDLIKRF